MTELAYWLFRCEDRFLVQLDRTGELAFPQRAAVSGEHPADALFVGQWQGLPCYAAEVAVFPADCSGEPFSLRNILQVAHADWVALAARAAHLLDWQKQHRFCGQCGTLTQRQANEPAMRCLACGLLAYPRISPAVMVLVRDGRRLLLARSPRFKAGVFSALAGFVEAGETLEACAAREVREEVGVEIANLRYFGSQSWPFPNSLMIAFFADYAGGTITPEPSEIEAADWFLPEALPLLPEPMSISRRLIEAACQPVAEYPAVDLSQRQILGTGRDPAA